MKISIKGFVLLLLVVPQVAAGADASLARSIDDLFSDIAPSDPGCSVAVSATGRVTAAGYGSANLEHEIPITSETRFFAGSVAKQFVAAVIVQLSIEGRLSLNDGVRKHLPRLPAYMDGIKISHLLFHTSGIRDYISVLFLSGRFDVDVTTEEIYAILARQSKLMFPPGTQHSYSNSGYFLLGQIAQETTGKTLDNLASEMFFDPLEMTATEFHDDYRKLVKYRAEGYGRVGSHWGAFRSRFSQAAAGGIVTTAADLVRWYEWLFDASNEHKLKEIMLQRGYLNDGSILNYGYGLSFSTYRGLEMIGHTGSRSGYRANLTRSVSTGSTVVLLCNRNEINRTRRVNQLLDLMLPAVVSIDEADHQFAVVSPERYVGKYEFMPSLSMEVRLLDGELFSQLSKQRAHKLIPTGPGTFTYTNIDAQLRFEPADGVSNQLTLHQSGRTLTAKRISEDVPQSPSLERFVGCYESAEIGTPWVISEDEGRLWVRVGFNPALPLERRTSQKFVGPNTEVTFDSAEDTSAAGVRVDTTRASGFYFKRVNQCH